MRSCKALRWPLFVQGALLLVSAGCQIAPPVRLDEDLDVRAMSARVRLDEHLMLAPLEARYKVQELPREGEEPRSLEQLEDGVEIAFAPSLSDAERNDLSRLVEEALSVSFANVGRVAGGALSLATEAEDRGAQLFVRVLVADNRLAYLGEDTVLQTLDWMLLLTLPPWHLWIPDESFELRRSLEVEFCDVREPDRPLHRATIEGRYRASLNELQHGYVFLNSLRSLWSSGADRFAAENWQKLYDELAPHANLALQKRLIQEVETVLRSLLGSAAIRDRLTRGAVERARLYAVVVGQNQSGVRRAEADAHELKRLLAARSGMRKAHLVELVGGVTPARLKAAVQSLRTKAVDRVLFYFAGQGGTSPEGEYLLLAKSERMRLIELRRSFRSLQAENVAFVLDCSFGDEGRGIGRGGRTDGRSASASKASSYLKPLQDVDRGWQVLCAARAGQATGEYENHGLLTGLLLGVVEKSREELSISTLQARVSDRFTRRSRGLLGGEHAIFSGPTNGRRDFLIIKNRREEPTDSMEEK